MTRHTNAAQRDMLVAPEQPELKHLDGELWLARRLGLHGVLVVFDGTTDRPTRMTRMREAILERGLDQVICGRGTDGKTNTYAQAFERLYGKYLNGNPTRKGKPTC